MRRGDRWKCADCGATWKGSQPEGVYCDCGSQMTDENGSNAIVSFRSGPPPRDHLKRWNRILTRVGLLTLFISIPVFSTLMMTLHYLFGVGLVVAFSLGMYISYSKPLRARYIERLRRVAKKRVESLNTRQVLPIGVAQSGMSTFIGQVKVLEPVGASDPELAVSLNERRSAGRFLVQDETGAAFVDDDLVELFATEDGRLEDGDWVRISGPGRPGSLPTPSRQAGTYRDAGAGFIFDGQPKDPIEIVKLIGKPGGAIPERVRADGVGEHESGQEIDHDGTNKVERGDIAVILMLVVLAGLWSCLSLLWADSIILMEVGIAPILLVMMLFGTRVLTLRKITNWRGGWQTAKRMKVNPMRVNDADDEEEVEDEDEDEEEATLKPRISNQRRTES